MSKLLTPREHGAYAQLAFPLLSGLIVGGPTLPGAALTASVVCAFLAYEPVAVLLGVRGVRLQREQAGSARRQILILAPIALLLAAGALLLAPGRARLLALVPAALAAVVAALLPIRRVKTIAGETATASAFAGMHLPVAAAAGAAGLALWAPAAVWFVAFFVATLAVHAIKARQKQRDAWLRALAVGSTIAVGVGAIVIAVAAPPLRLPALALAVPVGAVLAVNLGRVHPRALKRVGWTLVACDAAALGILALL